MGLFQALRAVDPNLFGTRDWFPGRHFFCGPALGWGASGLGMIVIRSEQLRSRSCPVHSRVHASMSI